MPEPARPPLAGFARGWAIWWRPRGDLLQDSALAAVFIAAAFAPPLAANGLALGELARHPLGARGRCWPWP